MACDLPENYERFMDAFQFIKDVPVEWEKSIYLEAEPMEYVTIARKDKNSENWFVGNTAGEADYNSVIKLDFLEKGAKYEATIYADAADADYKDNPHAYKIYKETVTSESVLPMTMARGGGFAISLEEK